jgi:flagellar basal-body rod protein FlgB
MTIFDRTMTLLEHVLDLRAARHRIIASNIANEETPGYRAKELDFQDALASAVRQPPGGGLLATHARHFGQRSDAGMQVAGRLVELPAGELPLDANSVNLELEMAKLADNGLNYNTAATIMAIRFRQLLDAVRGMR